MYENLPKSKPAPPSTTTGGSTTHINATPKQAPQGGGATGTSGKK